MRSRGRRAALLALAGGAAALAAGQVALAGMPATYGEGLHISTGAIVAPDGSVWVSDHNAGFCRMTAPTEDAPAVIDHSVADPTCLGGLLPGAKPGPDAAGQPAFLDPSPDFPDSGDELAFIPDGAAPSSEVVRARWNADAKLFEFDADNALDLITLGADPNQPDRARPTAAGVGPDGRVYVVFQRSSSIQRIARPASTDAANPPVAQLIGRTTDGRGTSAIAVGRNVSGVMTVYVGETGGITQITAPLTPGVARVPVPAPLSPQVAGAGSMVVDPSSAALYVGTADALDPGDAGIDVLHEYDVAPGAATFGQETDAAFPVTGFTAVGGVGLDTRDGGVLVLDDPAIITPGEPIGTGRLFHVGRPVARILSGPSGATNDATPTFTMGGDPTVECKLVPLDAAFAPCASHPFVTAGDPISLTPTAPLAEGDYRMVVRSSDGGIDGYADSRAFRVDLTAPATPAIAAPAAGSTTNAAPWFVFDAAGEAGPSWQCDLDGSGFVPCVAGRTYPLGLNQLTGGPHTLVIRSVDAAGNQSPPSDPVAFTTDATIPTVDITSPVAGPPTQATDVTLTFGSTDPDGPLTFGCRMDDEPFTACVSGISYTGLPDGVHTFEVHAGDVNGNLGPAASVDVVVDTTAPAVNAAGWASLTGLAGTFGLVADEPATFRFAIEAEPDTTPGDPIPWQDPNVPGGAAFSFAAAEAGAYRLHVEATDAAGNVSTVSHPFTVADLTPPPPATDQTPPVVAIQSPAPGTTTKGSLDAVFTVDDPSGVSAVTCGIDGGGAVACASPFPIAGLGKGTHTLTVTGTDAFGNSASATRTWEVSSGGAGGLDVPAPLALSRATVPATVTSAAVRNAGLRVAVGAPAGTRVIRVRILSASGSRVLARTVVAARAGRRVLRLKQPSLVRALRRGGVYRVELTPGTNSSRLGRPTVRKVRVRR